MLSLIKKLFFQKKSFQTKKKDDAINFELLKRQTLQKLRFPSFEKNPTYSIHPLTFIIANSSSKDVTAKEEGDVNKIKPLLIDQITSRVRWRESIDYMIKEGVSHFLEIGAGKVLSGLVKKINKDLKISNVNSIEDIKND